MTTPITINGSWYIVELNQQEKDQCNAALVLSWGRGLFKDYDGRDAPAAQRSFEELPEIAALGSVRNVSFLYESPVNYWEPLQQRKVERKRGGESFEGSGNLSAAKYHASRERLITSPLAEEVLKVDVQKPHYLNAWLYVVRYRDSRDINTNPFHQTAIIAKDEDDLRSFRQRECPNIFDEGYPCTLQELVVDPEMRFQPGGIVVMPEVISRFQKVSWGEFVSYYD